MVKHIPAASIFPDKFCHNSHQAQLRSSLSPRHHLSQLLAQGFFVAKHKTPHPIQHKHRYCHKRKHSCPRLDADNPSFDKSKQPFRIAESFLAAKPPRIFLSRLLSTHPSIAQKMPDAPFAFSISLATLRHIQPSPVFVTVTQTPNRSPSKVPRQSKMFEFDPLAIEINLYVVFRANDERNSQFIEQIDQFNISKCAVSSQKQSRSGNRMKHFINECAHEVALITAAAIFKRVLDVRPPVKRYGARAGAKRGNQEMLWKGSQNAILSHLKSTFYKKCPDVSGPTRYAKRLSIHPKPFVLNNRSLQGESRFSARRAITGWRRQFRS